MDSPLRSTEPVRTPRIGIRLLWWFGIYFGGQLPLIQVVFFFPFFPFGLLDLVPPPQDTNPAHQPSFVPFIVAAYGFYLAHFILSVWFSSATAFRILMIALLVVVVFNTVSCWRSLDAQSHFAP